MVIETTTETNCITETLHLSTSFIHFSTSFACWYSEIRTQCLQIARQKIDGIGKQKTQFLEQKSFTKR